ncbi:MAG: serine/threonine protein kinase [Pirellulaceae bacterium]
MAKSRIGPFALEVPLAPARGTGQVFRGVHVEQRKLAALRVFKVPMGMTPESRQAYADQLEELKRLRHPGIVRCFGGGFDTRSAYLAYQLVEGESLESLLDRRERLPWETALEYSQQIVEAVQHAHQSEWYHGRLKPDKVLVARDGVVKVCDWRREAISFALGERRPSVDQLKFTAPEALNGGEGNEKADLYSVGALMYFMLTGQPPFGGDDQNLKRTIVENPVPDVGKSVLDCPVWLSAIIGQLLSKDPAERPYSATALLLAFKEAEKRQSQGVGVLQHATGGFSPIKLQTSREEAEKVLGVKKKKKRKQRETSFLDQTWVLLLGFIGAVAAVVWFLLPFSEATLRKKAEALLPPNSDEWSDWQDARSDYMSQLVDRFPEGENADWANQRIAWVNARGRQRELERENRLNRQTKWTDPERQYWRAWEFEQFGDLWTARDKYRAILKLFSKSEDAVDLCYLSKEALERINAKGQVPSELKQFVERRLEQAKEDYDAARIQQARETWESILQLYAQKEEVEAQVAEARERLSDLGSP